MYTRENINTCALLQLLQDEVMIQEFFLRTQGMMSLCTNIQLANMRRKDRKSISDLHFLLLQSVCVQQVGGGLGIVGQLRLGELRAERLQGLGRGLHHEGESLDRLRKETCI